MGFKKSLNGRLFLARESWRITGHKSSQFGAVVAVWSGNRSHNLLSVDDEVDVFAIEVTTSFAYHNDMTGRDKRGR